MDVQQGPSRSLEDLNSITSKIIGCAIEVHKELGRGLLESVYEICLAKEFLIRNIYFQRQFYLPVTFKDEVLNLDFRIDFLVANEIVLEMKLPAVPPVAGRGIRLFVFLFFAATGRQAGRLGIDPFCLSSAESAFGGGGGLKAIDKLLPVHEAQLLTYLKLSGKRLGLLINFNEAMLKNGIRRMVNGF